MRYLRGVLQALTQERDWEGCLPAAIFSLPSAAHESTGFTPAKLVYVKALRSPMCMMSESWEEFREDITILECFGGFLERLHVARKIAEENVSTPQLRAKCTMTKRLEKGRSKCATM